MPKTSVRQGLQRLGVQLRTAQETKGHARPLYGFVYVAGKLVEHPVEQKRIKIILGLSKKGLKSWRIKEELAKLGIAPRSGSSWCHKTIKRIIERSS